MSKEFYPSPYQLKALTDILMELKAKGSSLILNWGEETDCWEVSFITREERYYAVNTHLLFALQEVQRKAKEVV